VNKAHSFVRIDEQAWHGTVRTLLQHSNGHCSKQLTYKSKPHSQSSLTEITSTAASTGKQIKALWTSKLTGGNHSPQCRLWHAVQPRYTGTTLQEQARIAAGQHPEYIRTASTSLSACCS